MDSRRNQAHWESFASPSIPSNNQPAQQQSHAMFPPVGIQNEARKYTAVDWDAQRPEITRLYESATLESVMKVMRERHRLEAT